MRKTKKKPLTAMAVLSWVVFALYLPFFIAGRVLYYFSKLLRAFALLLLNKRHTAHDELVGFFRVWSSIRDINN